MFKKQVQPLQEVLYQFLRSQGLETPLQQHRLLAAWDEVAGELAARYTGEKFIRNQTLHVKILSPALRQDLLMRRTALLAALNQAVGGFVISDIRI